MSARALALCVAMALWIPLPASAHGRQPSLGQIAFDPADPDHVVVRGTWAFLTTHDHGSTFTWTCASAVGFDRTIEDPRIAVMPSGLVLAGIFDGLSRSDPSACDYTLVTDPLLHRTLVIDVARDPMTPRGAWIATSPGARPNTILYTPDEGETYELRSTFAMGILLERVVPSPSDPLRVYVSGVQLETATEPRHAFVWRSSDGGRTFTPTEIPLLDVDRSDYGERNVHVDAVDPSDPLVVLAHTIRRTTDMMPERLFRSEDGAQTFTLVSSVPEITGVALSEDGTHVWTGSWYGGLFRSDDHGRTFDTLDPALAVRCLAYRPGELWLCTDDVSGPFALARSSDLGVTIDPLWTFRDSVNDTGCPLCSSQVGEVCPVYWSDVEVDLGLVISDGAPFDPDAAARACIDTGVVPMDAGVDAGVALPSASCGCRASDGRSPDARWLVLGLALLAVRRRARR